MALNFENENVGFVISGSDTTIAIKEGNMVERTRSIVGVLVERPRKVALLTLLCPLF